MNSLQNLENIIISVLEWIITAFFGIILLVTILLVMLRYVFNSGLYGGNELMSYLFVYTTALGAALSIGSNEHIKITFFVGLFPPLGQKIVNAFGILTVGFLNTVLIFMSIPWMQKVGGFESPTLRIPNAWVQFGVPLGCSFAVIFCVFRLIKIFRKDTTDVSTTA